MTCELHDSYFRWMTINHAIPKIEWALNYYITQSRQKSSGSCSYSSRRNYRRDVVGKATDKMKRSFFQAAIVSILFYGCTTWTLTKRLEKKLDGNYTRMLRTTLNRSWRQHTTKQQLYSHLPPIMKTIQVKRTRHAENCWRSRDDLKSDVLRTRRMR